MLIGFFRTLAPVLAIATVAASALPVGAEGLRPSGYLVEGGVWKERTWSATAGVFWDWGWRRPVGSFEAGGLTEVFVSHWNAQAEGGGRGGFTQVGVLPMLRLRPDGGRSPWFVEAGIGISTMNPIFATDRKRFSTAFNFVDVVGVGHSFGANGQHEIGLRLQHVSNASIRSPNPGQNFVQLRYASRF